ncbi:MAG: Ig-like domain-containing protein, partial [Candidatus Eremiobacteraeota bacterium]|nr:Ig-like domain-containing protein [Candidatus Eremiobacteraeota bacterium]
FVGYGAKANCFTGSGSTATLNNTTAAFRNGGGQQNTNDNAADFSLGAPIPRNSGIGTPPAVPVTTVAVTPSPAAVTVGSTVQLTARGTDSTGNPSPTTFTWATSNTAVARVDSTGRVRGVAVSSTPVTITATSANGVKGTAAVTVGAPGTITSITWSGTPTPASTIPAGFQTQLFTP